MTLKQNVHLFLQVSYGVRHAPIFFSSKWYSQVKSKIKYINFQRKTLWFQKVFIAAEKIEHNKQFEHTKEL